MNIRLLSVRPMLALWLAALLAAGCAASDRPASPDVLAPAGAPDEPAAIAEPPQQPEAASRWLTPPVPAEDPMELADQLAMAERAVRDPSVTGPELAWMAHLQQMVYRRLVRLPDLRETVIAALPADLRTEAAANVQAGAELRAMVTPGSGLPDWRIVEPAPAEELLAHYRAAESEFGVPWTYVAAIHLVETVFGRIRGTSVAGAQGPMQFMPATWAAYGEGDINDNRDAIRAAARYLRANGAPSNMANAVYRYNPSQRYVRAITAYGEAMRAAPETFRGYYNWQVYYITTGGDVHLPVGYTQD